MSESFNSPADPVSLSVNVRPPTARVLFPDGIPARFSRNGDSEDYIGLEQYLLHRPANRARAAYLLQRALKMEDRTSPIVVDARRLAQFHNVSDRDDLNAIIAEGLSDAIVQQHELENSAHLLSLAKLLDDQKTIIAALLNSANSLVQQAVDSLASAEQKALEAAANLHEYNKILEAVKDCRQELSCQREEE